MGLSAKDSFHLKEALQIAVVKCSERCLYQAAKWYVFFWILDIDSELTSPRAAELLDALPERSADEFKGQPPTATYVHPAFFPSADPTEAALEARELNRYLLAKSFFDCKEFDRCAAVFLPDSLLSGLITAKVNEAADPRRKGKAPAVGPSAQEQSLPEMSQKSLFLALYAKVMFGEKQKDEDSEMIMGPQDLGAVVNKQLLTVSRFLERWFADRKKEGDPSPSQGFLEYLYGMVLVKEKNDSDALNFLMQSVHLFPWNWGCWLEITNLISRVEQVSNRTKGARAGQRC